MSDNYTHSQMALLVMDVQAGIVTRFAQTDDFLNRMNAAITAARAVQIPVIYVVVTFRPGYPEISPRKPDAWISMPAVEKRRAPKRSER